MHTPRDALMIDLYQRPRSYSWLRVAAILMGSGNWKAVTLIRLGQYFHLRGWRRAGRWSRAKLRREFGCFVQPTAAIGPGLRLPHPNGIVIGSKVNIGVSCVIYQQMALGGARRGDYGTDAYPSVGNGVMIYAGAKLIGEVAVGRGAVIGANAVVLRDVPAGHSAVGIPARDNPNRKLDA